MREGTIGLGKMLRLARVNITYLSAHYPPAADCRLGRKVHPGIMSVAPSANTMASRRRACAGNHGRCRKAHNEATISAPPGSASAIGAYGPSSRKAAIRRLVQLKRETNMSQLRWASWVAVTIGL
jgi:hypothetical protein